ncbi:hypothetical protein RvY_13346 [Ramazzottius varieornatus]|uniref:Serrate RNA effector molecule homolog n=1 Tax=Ramazzottius varieornatus TaxID=947166 RepID=A0A1D1VSV9_RAMVA|nr:hypothetical protein RvY_13346 [Ramazzottius varieornatus]
MGDSDDEMDQRRSRDKFRRNDDGDRAWNDRRSGGGRDSGGWQRGSSGGMRDRPSKFSSPPDRRDGSGMKRTRRDWDDERDDTGNDRRSGGRGMDAQVDGPNGPTQPAIMSFKQFLATLDDSVDDDDAVQRYREYKMDFKRQQIHEFFVAHKDEEWFRQKYHPEESAARTAEKQAYIQKRLDAYMGLLKLNKIDDVKLDIDDSNQLVKLLDMALVLMEGGTEADFKSLDDAKDSESMDNGEEKTEDETEIKEEAVEKPIKEEKMDTENGESNVEGGASTGEGGEKTGEAPKLASPTKQRKVFHKTTSIFLRNLPPNITKTEVENVCKRFPGFIKVAIADPLPERRFFRRGWATFEPDVNIKEICWNLSNIRLRDTELGAIVNRDLTRRIRPTSGIAAHKPVVRSCIQLAARIIQNLDNQAGFWVDEKDKANPDQAFVKSRNPLLKDITDYLIEEGSAEEEEYEGGIKSEAGEFGEEKKDKDMETDDNAPTIERVDDLLKVLDRLLLYIRIVHSLDFYNCSDYPLEDEMPNRCGIMHVRGPPPPHQVSADDATAYVKGMESKLEPWLVAKQKLTKEELTELGKKDQETEVQRFIDANTKKQSEDKWLCPLSGKKFKGADFVHKHILNKHGEKVEEVRKDVEYFNNYLADPKRPSLPEHPVTSQQRGGQGGGMGGSGGVGLAGAGPMGGNMGGNPFGFGHPLHGRLGFPDMRMPFPLPGPFPPPFMGMHPGMGPMGMGDFFGRRGGGMGGRGPFGPRHDRRDMVSYKDLDAPGDDDFP